MTLFSSLSSRLSPQRPASVHAEPTPVAIVDVPPAVVEPKCEFSEPSLDSIGRTHEEVRDAFKAIVRRANEVLAMRDDVLKAAEHVGAILRQNEFANTGLVEKGVMLALEEQAHNALKERARALQEENDVNLHKVQLLTAEVERHGELVDNREKRIAALEEELAGEKANAADSRGELERARAATERLEEELISARGEIVKGDMTIGAMQIEAVATNSRLSTAEYHLKATQNSLAEAQNEAKTLRESLADAERRLNEYATALRETDADLENRNNQISALDAKLAAAHAEHGEARTFWQRQAEAHAEELVKRKSEIDDLSSRAHSAEALYEGARSELQTRNVELRRAERRAEELQSRLAPLEDRVRIAEEEMANLSLANNHIAASYTRVNNRSHALLRGMRDQKAKLEASEQRARMLEEQLAAESKHFDQTVTRLRATVQTLNEQVEKEKVARFVALGALEAARSRAAQESGASVELEATQQASSWDADGAPADEAEEAPSTQADAEALGFIEPPANAPAGEFSQTEHIGPQSETEPRPLNGARPRTHPMRNSRGGRKNN